MSEREDMEIHGDGAELHAHGAVLSSAGDDVAEIARRLHQRVEELRFNGPAAERFRAQMQDREARLSRVSQQLDELAGLVQQYGDTLRA